MTMIAPFPSISNNPSGEISRLLTAAVVNRGFCKLLLTNPATALARGYNGESFRLGSEEQNLVLSIQAKSLADFASQLAGVAPHKVPEGRPHRLRRVAAQRQM